MRRSVFDEVKGCGVEQAFQGSWRVVKHEGKDRGAPVEEVPIAAGSWLRRPGNEAEGEREWWLNERLSG